MGTFHWEPEWVEIIRQQERDLRYKDFTREDALALGLKIAELAKEKYHGGAAIRIIEDGMTIFAYKMPGSSLENDWWAKKKLAVSRQSGTSSLRAYVEAEDGQRDAFWLARPDNYAACGGCFPVRMEDGSAWAYVLVSGLEHFEDHQVIVDAMSWQLDKEVPSII
jgi:uncharacterized protein (UPF0303 family)